MGPIRLVGKTQPGTDSFGLVATNRPGRRAQLVRRRAGALRSATRAARCGGAALQGGGRELDGEALALRAHSVGFWSLRQQPFGEVQALLRLAQLLPQLAHLGFERFEPSLELAPGRTLELAPAGTLPQALGPQPEHNRERRVTRGMPRLRRERDYSGQVDDAQHDGDRVPNRALEGHGESGSRETDHQVCRVGRAPGNYECVSAGGERTRDRAERVLKGAGSSSAIPSSRPWRSASPHRRHRYRYGATAKHR